MVCFSAVCFSKNVIKIIVKKIENTDQKSIETVDVEEVRQVISLETSQKMKDMMQLMIIMNLIEFLNL